MVFQGIRSHLRLAQIVFLEAVTIDDQDSVGLQIAYIYLQCRGVHRDQDVNRITGGVDLIRRKVELESADARNGSCRGPNLRRIVRESGNVVAVKRDRVCKLAAGDLHAVAGVTRESYDGLIDDFALVFDWRNFCECRHFWPDPRTSLISPRSAVECGSIEL